MRQEMRLARAVVADERLGWRLSSYRRFGLTAWEPSRAQVWTDELVDRSAWP